MPCHVSFYVRLDIQRVWAGGPPRTQAGPEPGGRRGWGMPFSLSLLLTTPKRGEACHEEVLGQPALLPSHGSRQMQNFPTGISRWQAAGKGVHRVCNGSSAAVPGGEEMEPSPSSSHGGGSHEGTVTPPHTPACHAIFHASMHSSSNPDECPHASVHNTQAGI